MNHAIVTMISIGSFGFCLACAVLCAPKWKAVAFCTAMAVVNLVMLYVNR